MEKQTLSGQVAQIKLVKSMLDTKIEEARIQKTKNAKLYRTLGTTAGMAIAIILI